MRLLAGVLFVLFAVLPGAAYAACAAERTPPALARFDAFARAVMAEWRVPGLALGIIRDGETLYCAGYGFADVDNLTAATPETVFAIGSISKSFTVAGLAMLVDEGRLDWDAPVQSVLPGFALADAETVKTRIATLKRDLRSGAWDRKYGHLRTQPEFDAGFRLVKFSGPGEGGL